MISRWPAPRTRRTPYRRRAVITVAAALAAALVPLRAAHAGTPPALGPTTSEAIWIDRDTVAWNGVDGAASTQLVYSRDGSITVKGASLTSDDARRLRLTRTLLSDAQKARFPYLKDYTAWSVDPRDRDRVREALGGQIVAAQWAANGAVSAVTGVQIAGVLDELYGRATKAELGPVFHRGCPTLAVWAPTAAFDFATVPERKSGQATPGCDPGRVAKVPPFRRTTGLSQHALAAYTPTPTGSRRAPPRPPRRTPTTGATTVPVD